MTAWSLDIDGVDHEQFGLREDGGEEARKGAAHVCLGGWSTPGERYDGSRCCTDRNLGAYGSNRSAKRSHGIQANHVMIDRRDILPYAQNIQISGDRAWSNVAHLNNHAGELERRAIRVGHGGNHE